MAATNKMGFYEVMNATTQSLNDMEVTMREKLDTFCFKILKIAEEVEEDWESFINDTHVY